MRTVWQSLLVACVSVLAGCPYTTIDSYACPQGGTTLTYDNFGRAFMNDWCQSCHASTSSARSGAPGEFIFDSAEQVRLHKARIFVRSASTNDSMPPGPVDPSIEDRIKLAEWLACGAP